jgi:endonuclease-3
MRTSRVSRDTSRVVAASRAQRTLRQTRSVANITAQANGSTLKKEGSSDSELSSIPADSGSDRDARPVKKRRIAQDAPTTVKHESKEISVATIASPKKESKPKRARRAPAKKITGSDGSVKIEPPANWEEIYALTREMRNENLAPVDTMGCESLADRERSPRDQRFQTLIALMLSSQTKDTVTSVAMRGMQENMPGVRLTQPLLTIATNYLRASTSNPSSLSNLPPSMPSSTKSASTTSKPNTSSKPPKSCATNSTQKFLIPSRDSSRYRG